MYASLCICDMLQDSHNSMYAGLEHTVGGGEGFCTVAGLSSSLAESCMVCIGQVQVLQALGGVVRHRPLNLRAWQLVKSGTCLCTWLPSHESGLQKKKKMKMCPA